MTKNEKPTKKPTMPKGGRKGGTLFPKINLEEAVEYAKKLVAKTQTGSQPATTVLTGVFGSGTSRGKVRASALKQFDLLEGRSNAYQATKLAKEINAAPEEDRGPLLQRAFLNSKLFKDIFDTFHGDTVTKAKIRQRALGLHVHTDSADECVELFIDSAVAAGLGTLSGDSITLVKADAVARAVGDTAEGEGAAPPEEPEAPEGAVAGASAGSKDGAETATGEPAQRPNKTGVTVTLNVDSSSDPDKLEKQLNLLRQFGVI